MKKLVIIMVLLLSTILLAACGTETLYTFTYDSRGGTLVETVTDITFDEITIPVDPVLLGYTFEGWYDSDNLTNKVEMNALTEEYLDQFVIEDGNCHLNLFANYEVNEYVITFKDFDDSIFYTFPAVFLADLETIHIPSEPTRDGYTFTGWDLMIGFMPPEDITVTATYELTVVVDDEDVFEVAFITDSGSIDDESYNQSAWEGMQEYCEEHELTYKYYQPSDISSVGYFNAIVTAVESGATLVVTSGWLHNQSVYEAQTYYPNVDFVMIDGRPVDETWTVSTITSNTVAYMFDSEEAGFLAGYASVYDGFSKLGFIGGAPVPEITKYATGYFAGAYYAANELMIDIEIDGSNIEYLGSFSPSEQIQNIAATMYQNDVEVIFSVAGGANMAVMAAAEDEGAWMIGADHDQSAFSSTVLTSAMKNINVAAQAGVENYDNSRNDTGIIYLGSEDNGVLLPMDTSRFSTFTQLQYDTIYAKLVAGTVVVPNDYYSYDTFLQSLTNTNTTDAPNESEIMTGF